MIGVPCQVNECIVQSLKKQPTDTQSLVLAL